jgi:hypothetical protein
VPHTGDVPTAEPCEVLLVGGRSGVGKSSAAMEASELLRRREVAHVMVEGDALDHAHPAPLGDPHRTALTRDNLAALWANYHRRGYRRLIYTNTVAVLESAMITGAMGGHVRPIGVLLTAGEQTAAERLRRRERGSELETHLRRSAEAAALLDDQAPDGVHRVPTDGRTVSEVAEHLVALTGWAAAADAGHLR